MPCPATPVVLDDAQRSDLVGLARSRTLPHQLVQGARIVLACADGESGAAIAARVQVNKNTVVKWRKRYAEHGIEGLHDEPRAGRPRTHGDERVAEVINAALQTRPAHRTQWSVRAMEEHTGCRRARCSLDPPDKAVVLCVDEKSQIQALERHQPMLPMGLGHAQGVSHGHVRHGTTTLFAALDIATGEVHAQCKRRHRHQDYLAFLRHVDKCVPEDLDIHLVVDNHATHKHAKVRAWLARRPRYHVHYTPTYASWLNQVERWFGIITQQAIRRGSSNSVPQLRKNINEFVENHNRNCRPFAWTATAGRRLPVIADRLDTGCRWTPRASSGDWFTIFLAASS